MKVIFKSVVVFFIALLLNFILVINVEANDEIATVSLENGASLRTTGERQGIKFMASANTFDGATEHGFIVAKGKYTLEEIKLGANARQQKVIVNGNKCKFNLVIYGLDSSDDYVSYLTVVAYIETNNGIQYSEAVTKNMAEVAMKAKTTGVTGKLIEDVVSDVKNDYKIIGTSQDKFVISSNIDEEFESMEYVKKGETIEIPKYSKDGYTFEGWDKEVDEFYTITDEDLELVARWYDNDLFKDFTFEGNILTGYYGNENEIIIPEYYYLEGVKYDILSIKDYAFKNNDNLISVIIPNCVELIGLGAFYGCNSLKSITVPFTGSNMVDNTKRNFGYIFGATANIYNDEYVPESLSEVIITRDTIIYSCAFTYCYNIKNIILPDTITKIGESAFLGCTSLKKIIIPDSVSIINKCALGGCTNLESITIPFIGKTIEEDDINHIGYIFGDNPYYDLYEYVPESLMEVVITSNEIVYSSSFYKCSNLVSIKFTNNVIAIDNSAFYGCTSLKNIELPNSITSIGSFAFYGCTSLESIKLPNSITSIGSSVFYGCTSLESIKLPNSITSIGSSAFYGCTNLKNIELPNSITSIGSSSFSGCTSLTKVIIPNSVITIEGSVFSGCSSLQEVFIPNSVQKIGGYFTSENSNLIIYCEATSIPSGWNKQWNYYGNKVVLGYN